MDVYTIVRTHHLLVYLIPSLQLDDHALELLEVVSTRGGLE